MKIISKLYAVLALVLLLGLFASVHVSYAAEDAGKYCNEGETLISQGKYKDALAKFDQALKINPKDLASLCNKGYVLIKLKNYSDAVISLTRAYELDGKDRIIRIDLALALKMRARPGDSKKADDICAALVKEGKKDEYDVCAYGLMGKKAEMLKLMKELVAKRPALKGQFKKAIELEKYQKDADFIAVVGK